tara:strand:- start:267 stop:1505 length:1239 start_codon:yes stop_codon:yes gene_type:complete
MIFYFGCDNNPAVFTDCNGLENGLSVEDNCNICDEDPTNNCIQDCDGNWGGIDGIPNNGDDATFDECGTCGGNGKLDCNDICISPDEHGNYISEDGDFDCFGICGGDAVVDDCHICNGLGAIYDCGCLGIERDCTDECGGNAVRDCNGDCIGSAILDDCNDCSGGLTGLNFNSNKDCNGECGGTAAIDECGVCHLILSNSCVQDCLGAWGGDAVADCTGLCEGTAVTDDCGICSGDGSTCSEDCLGIEGGTAVEDCAGECDGDAIDEDEDGICDDIDDCIGICDICDVWNGDGSTCSDISITDGCMIPENTVHLNTSGDVLYNITSDIAGFQFEVDEATVNGASGGAAADAGFTVSPGGSTVLGFSFSGTVIPTGCGTLITLDLDGTATGLSGLIFSPTGGSEAIIIEYYQP